jgi:hypothetical protein
MKTLVDSFYLAHNDPSRHWNGDHGERAQVAPGRLEKAMALYHRQQTHGHAWIFTDDSFREIYTQLAIMGVTRLKPVRVYNTVRNSNSFCVIMEKMAGR